MLQVAYDLWFHDCYFSTMQTPNINYWNCKQISIIGAANINFWNCKYLPCIVGCELISCALNLALWHVCLAQSKAIKYSRNRGWHIVALVYRRNWCCDVSWIANFTVMDELPWLCGWHSGNVQADMDNRRRDVSSAKGDSSQFCFVF